MSYEPKRKPCSDYVFTDYVLLAKMILSPGGQVYGKQHVQQLDLAEISVMSMLNLKSVIKSASRLPSIVICMHQLKK